MKRKLSRLSGWARLYIFFCVVWVCCLLVLALAYLASSANRLRVDETILYSDLPYRGDIVHLWYLAGKAPDLSIDLENLGPLGALFIRDPEVRFASFMKEKAGIRDVPADAISKNGMVFSHEFLLSLDDDYYTYDVPIVRIPLLHSEKPKHKIYFGLANELRLHGSEKVKSIEVLPPATVDKILIQSLEAGYSSVTRQEAERIIPELVRIEKRFADLVSRERKKPIAVFTLLTISVPLAVLSIFLSVRWVYRGFRPLNQD